MLPLQPKARSPGAPPRTAASRSRSRSRSCSEDSPPPPPPPPPPWNRPPPPLHGVVRIGEADINHLVRLISEQQEAKRRLDEADAELRRFLFAIAYEIRRANGLLPQS